MSAAPVLTKILNVTFIVHQGEGNIDRYSFDRPRLTLGRGPENDIILAHDVKVSRQHVEFIVTPNEVRVRNLSDKNPISLDGEVITEKVLKPGSILRMGESEIKVQFDPPQQMQVAGGHLAPVATSAAGQLQTQAHGQGHVVIAPAGAMPTPASSGTPGLPRKPGAPGPARQAPRRAPPSSGSKGPFYLILVAVLLGGAYLFSQDQAKKKREVRLRDSVSTELAINQSQGEYEKTVKEMEKKGMDTIQYRMSQEQYLRGFRDYRQGQYIRAMEGFQAALSFYPQHELARKYYTLAKRKFDEQVQFNMIQGKRYYGLGNYRLCMGYYSNVIKMKKDERDPIRREALQYYNECEVKLRGKY